MKNYFNPQRDAMAWGNTPTMTNMYNNSIMTLAPYKEENGFWVFDDPSTGLVREAFVAGADKMCDDIDAATGGDGKINIAFSNIAFPGFKFRLIMQETVEQGQGGTTYVRTDNMTPVWLCPALLKYFPVPPPSIYISYK